MAAANECATPCKNTRRVSVFLACGPLRVTTVDGEEVHHLYYILRSSNVYRYLLNVYRLAA